MPVSPVYVGSTRFPLSITWLRDDGTPVNLTGAAITVRFSADSGTPSAFTGTGTLTVISAVAGTLTYKLSAADIATPGNYHIQFVADYGGGDDEKSDSIPFYILASL